MLVPLFLCIVLVQCKDPIAFPWRDNSFYSWVSFFPGKLRSSSDSFVHGGSLVFRFFSKSEQNGWKLKVWYFLSFTLRSQDDNVWHGTGSNDLSYMVFNRDEHTGYMLGKDKSSSSAFCMKMTEKPVQDFPCQNGVYAGTQMITKIDPYGALQLSDEFTAVFSGCNFDKYIFSVFPSNATVANDYTFYFDLYDPSRVHRICLLDACIDMVDYRVLRDDETNLEFAIPSICL